MVGVRMVKYWLLVRFLGEEFGFEVDAPQLTAKLDDEDDECERDPPTNLGYEEARIYVEGELRRRCMQSLIIERSIFVREYGDLQTVERVRARDGWLLPVRRSGPAQGSYLPFVAGFTALVDAVVRTSRHDPYEFTVLMAGRNFDYACTVMGGKIARITRVDING